MNSELLGLVRSVVNAIPFEQFGANSTDKDILHDKIENDELYRLDCVNRPYTEVLINQMKLEDAEIASLQSAASLMRSKTKIPTEHQTPDARSDINQRNNRLGRNNSYHKKTKDKNRGEHFKLINISR